MRFWISGSTLPRVKSKQVLSTQIQKSYNEKNPKLSRGVHMILILTNLPWTILNKPLCILATVTTGLLMPTFIHYLRKLGSSLGPASANWEKIWAHTQVYIRCSGVLMRLTLLLGFKSRAELIVFSLAIMPWLKEVYSRRLFCNLVYSRRTQVKVT